MIAEVVSFHLPPGTDRAAAVDFYRQTAPVWAKNTELIAKYYFFDEKRSTGGGIYISPSREAAARWHGDEYRAMIRSRYHALPRFEILDLVMHIDPKANQITDIPADIG